MRPHQEIGCRLSTSETTRPKEIGFIESDRFLPTQYSSYNSSLAHAHDLFSSETFPQIPRAIAGQRPSACSNYSQTSIPRRASNNSSNGRHDADRTHVVIWDRHPRPFAAPWTKPIASGIGLVAAARAALDASLRALDELERHDTLATALYEVTGHFPDPERWALVSRVITLTKATADLDQQGRLLSALEPHGSDEQLWEIYGLGCAIQNPNARARCLAALAGSLPSDLREAALEGAIAAAREVGNLGARADALVEVARHLNGNQRSWVLDQALSAAYQMTGGHAQIVVLTHLAPHLSTEQITRALELARNAANEIGAEEIRALALTRLLAMLEGRHSDLLEQDAFQAAQKVADPSTRMAALRRIAKYGQAAQAEEALQSALTLATSHADAYDRADALGGISDMLTGEQWDAALLTLLKTGEELPRPELLKALRAFIPRLYELEGEAALLKLQRAVVDTGTWYP